MKNISLKIITPNGVVFDENVVLFETTTPNGKIVINYNHVNIIASINNCISYIKFKDNKKQCITINGLMYTTKTEIKVLADFFIFVDEIDHKKQKNEIEHDMEIMKKFPKDTPEYMKANNNLIKNQQLKAILEQKN